MPALRALGDAFRDEELVLAAPAALAPLVLEAGLAARVVDTRPLGPIAVERPHVAVNLHGRGPESHRRLFETRPERCIWFANAEVPASAGAPEWREREHEVRRWCRLLSKSGIAADPRRLRLPVPSRKPPAAARGATLLHPGAAYASRRWPAERWAAVARAELGRGRPVVVTGGPGEEGLAREVVARAGLEPDRALLGQDLLGLAATVAAAARVASGDTGVAHLATALGRPSVILFGPTSPELWGPPAGGRHRVLWAGTTGDPFAERADPGLLRIAPEEVAAALADV